MDNTDYKGSAGIFRAMKGHESAHPMVPINANVSDLVCALWACSIYSFNPRKIGILALRPLILNK